MTATTIPRSEQAGQEVPSTGWTDRRVAVVGVSLVAVGYVAMAVFAAVTLPWRGTGDALEHLDYIYQVLQGELPQPIGHDWVAADGTGPTPTGRHFVSQHPPLYYLLAAPLAAPFLDHDWHVAVALIRAANILVGVAGIAVMGWFGWALGGAWRVRLAIALPAAGAATFGYVRYAAEVYNDTLLTTVSMLAIAVCAWMLRHGLRPFALVAVTVLCVLGFGTKATFILTLGLVAVGLVVAARRHSTGQRGRGWLRGLAAAALVCAASVMSWGWFYARNAAVSGSWYQSTPDDVQVHSRPYRDTLQVLFDPEYYLIVPTGIVGQATGDFAALAEWVSSAIFGAAALVTAVVLIRHVRRRRGLPSAGTLLIAVLLAAHLAGHYAIQLAHATGYGTYNWRYFMPALLTVAVLLGLGVASLGGWSAVTLPGLVAVLGALNAASYVDYSVDKADLAVDPRQVLTGAQALAVHNGWPNLLPLLCLGVALTSVVALALLIARHRDRFTAVL